MSTRHRSSMLETVEMRFIPMEQCESCCIFFQMGNKNLKKKKCRQRFIVKLKHIYYNDSVSERTRRTAF